MPSLPRRVLALFVLLGLAACTLSSCAAPRPLPEPVPQDPPSSPVLPKPDPVDVSPSLGETKPTPANALASLRTFTKVVIYIKENYAFPERIKPKQMLLASLESVEKEISDVKVDGSVEAGNVKVTVGNRARKFDISRVTSLWKMSFTLKDVFAFIGQNLRPEVDPREVEYAATNGMLSTLDQGSVLLVPTEYSELKRSFKKEYGSIGAVIQFKEGELTLVKVLSGFPAAKAGLQKGDVLTRIGEDSTSSMDLKEVLDKLGGPVGSPVSLTVKRGGWNEPRVMTITRAHISVPGVRQKLLSQGVGYVRLKDFQGRATKELEAALEELEQKSGPEGLKGLVLDLRGNEGGLLEQSTEVADLFLSSGTILVATGMSEKLREEKRARPGGRGERPWPIAVLVDDASAAATEIVTGALKVQNRAIVIGRPTFGRGTVQVLYDFPDGSALRLTIASYQLQGGRPIQGIGITPDIELLPARVTRDRVALFSPPRLTSRYEQERSSSEGVQDREQPAARIRYLDPEGEDSEEEQERDSETLERIEEDFEVRFARDFLRQAPSVERGKMLQQAQGYVERIRSEEAARIQAAITGLGVDWSPGPTPMTPRLAVTLSPDAHQRIWAGDKVELVVTVENQGTEPVKRLRAWTDSPDSDFLDRREFLLGALMPGKRRSWKVPVQIPESTASRREPVTVRLQDDSGMLHESFTAELNIVEQPRPAFAFSWQVLDGCGTCNGNGRIERGEAVDVLVKITNTGTGKGMKPYALLKNGGDPSLVITQGRANVGKLAPGGTATARFQVKVNEDVKPGSAALKLVIVDGQLEEFVTDKLSLPMGSGERPVEGLVRNPPRILLEGVDPAQGGLVTTEGRFTLSGSASSERGPLDLYVLVNGQKVFFQRAATPGGPAQLQFSTEFELKEGLNPVQLVASEGEGISSRKTLVIRRRSGR